MRKILLHLCAYIVLFFALVPFVPAFFSSMWMLKLVLTEWGHWIALLCFVAAMVIAVKLDRRFLKAALALGIAGGFFLLPLAQAMWGYRSDVPFSTWFQLVNPPDTRSVVSKTVDFTHKGQSLPIDVVSNQGDTDLSPLIIVVHGGSWSSGKRSDLPELPTFLASQGYRVALVSYRFFPRDRFPAAIEDVKAAAQFLLQHRTDYGIDAKNVFFLGRSAGGQIAELVAQELVDEGQPVRAVISFYSPSDMIWGFENSKSWHVINGKETIGGYLGAHLTDASRDVYEQASPLYRVNKKTAPHLLVHGTNDDLVAMHHTKALEARLKQLGRPVELLEFSWATHGFDYFVRGPASIVTRQVLLRFLRQNIEN
jgi:acetyl esterase/lipase